MIKLLIICCEIILGNKSSISYSYEAKYANGNDHDIVILHTTQKYNLGDTISILNTYSKIDWSDTVELTN